MSKYDDLLSKLREIFQIDRPDLDFGIYRVIHQRADAINQYLQNDLRKKVTAALIEKNTAARTQLDRDLAEARKAAAAAGFDPEASPRVKELSARLAALKTDSDDAENTVFSHLLTFFSRYYDKGDFISQRRYKGDTYAIPYAGEEVMLHWANKDQYYIKSSENFANYTFKLPDWRSVHFRLTAADTAKDNTKDADKERRFRLISPKTITRAEPGEEDSDTTVTEKILPVSEESGSGISPLGNKRLEAASTSALVLRFEYVPMPKGSKQADLNATAIKTILADPIVAARWADLATIRNGTEQNPDRLLLEKHLADYTAKNTADYFIHKNLRAFLARELDFYIKNEVMFLDDVQNAEKFADIEKNLRLIQCLRAIARELIDFLAQIEDFQKKLWLKKKFVVETHYCITMDRVPAKLHATVAANAQQRDEWKRLYNITLPVSSIPNYRESIYTTNTQVAKEQRIAPHSSGTPLELFTRPEYKYLVLDTRFFDADFKAALLESIGNLDEQCDGLLIHSENFQALNLLQERYREQVKCVYIDPPYNTGGDGFMYKDNYQHSSWGACIFDRLQNNFTLFREDGVIFISIDDNEVENLKKIGNEVFDVSNFIGCFLWKKKSTSTNVVNAIVSPQTDYQICYGKNVSSRSLNRRETTTEQREYPFQDEQGKYRTAIIEKKDSGEYARATMKFPILGIYPREGKRWQIGEKTAQEYEKINRFIVDNGIVRLKIYEQDDKSTFSANPTLLLDLGSTDSANKETNVDTFGKADLFSNPKPIELLLHFVKMGTRPNDIILDYFAGSGTTGHAVINLNREDGGQRKYILVEMGEHFNTVLKPRIQKVVYSADWKDGKPTAPASGISHCFKYIRLESYEDTLNNLELKDQSKNLDLFAASATATDADKLKSDYLLRYMLDVESKGSLLSVEDFRKPFDYHLRVATDSAGAWEERKIDLVETFNYLIGLRVKHVHSDFERGFVYVEGTLPSSEKTLVLWRDCEKLSYDELNKLCGTLSLNPKDSEYSIIYVNGDHTIPTQTQELESEGGVIRELKVRQIEPEFLSHMFATQE